MARREQLAAQRFSRMRLATAATPCGAGGNAGDANFGGAPRVGHVDDAQAAGCSNQGRAEAAQEP